jgi:hypothetical protein
MKTEKDKQKTRFIRVEITAQRKVTIPKLQSNRKAEETV